VFPVQLLDRMEVLSRVVEWRSPSFADVFARAFLVQVAAGVVVLVRRPSYRAAVPLVVFTSVALLGQRSVPHASLVLLPGLAAGLAGLGRLDGRERAPAFGAAAVAMAVLCLLVVRTSLADPDVDLRGYPVDALVWLDQRGVTAAGARVATEDTTGNLVELLRGRSAAVFFDDRYDLYPLALSRDYLDLHDGTARWEDVLDGRRVEVLLWRRPSPLASLVASSAHWRVVYTDARAVVACRRGGDATIC
jgi:hypothetical protein